MRADEFIIEGYKETKAEFIKTIPEQEVDNVINMYKQLVNKNQVQGNERNIDYWKKQGWENFSNFVNNKSTEPTKTQIKTNKVVGKSITLQENDQWLIVIPLDKSASCFYGKDSSWCTTKQHASQFENYYYKRDVILIYCLQKQTGGMWAIAGHKDTKAIEMFNKDDAPMTVAAFYKETGFDPRMLLKMAVDRHYPTIKGSKQKYQDAMAQLDTLIPQVSKRDKRVEDLLEYLKDGRYCANYIDELVESGQDISSLPESIVRAVVSFQPSYLEKLGNVSEKALIDAASNTSLALKYIQNPSPKVIDAALKFSGVGIMYIDDNLADQLILKYPKAAAYQAYRKDIRVPSMEKEIAKDPDSVLYYLNVYKEPWPAAEEAILKNEQAIPAYVKQNLKGQRWKKGEKALESMDPYYMYEYSVATKTRWPEDVENTKIADDTAAAVEYALHVLHDRFPAAEDAFYEISPETEELLVKYANEFDWDDYKHRWPEFFYDEEDLRHQRHRYNDD